MQRIRYEDMKKVFTGILLSVGFEERKASACAEIFATNSLEGVYTHGVNRFKVFVDHVKDGYVKPDAEPSLKSRVNAIEQWDGHLGPGPLNAVAATTGAVKLAKKNGIGLIGLANTNHWMRGGYYAWQAATENCILIAWTNTIANMPAWGALDAKLGNNPLVLGIPYQPHAIVLDMAMSQYAHGKLQLYARMEKQLEVFAGYDTNGELSTNAKEILESNRKLPAGYWKGAGLSLLLDLLAMILSGGQAVKQISSSGVESGLSQVFVAIDIEKLENYPQMQFAIEDVIQDYLSSSPVNKDFPVVYPGQRILQVKKANQANGIPVDAAIWDEILALGNK